MTKEEIENIKSNVSLNEAISSALPRETENRTILKDEQKAVKDDLLEFFFQGNFLGLKDAEEKIEKDKKQKIKDETHKEELKEIKKRISKAISETKKFLISDKTSEKNPSRILAEKIASVCFLLEYLGDSSFQDWLKDFGISLSFSSLEKSNPYFSDEKVKEAVVSLFSELKENERKKVKNSSDFSGIDFETIDSSLRFSKENPSGMTPAQFSSLVKMKFSQENLSGTAFSKIARKEYQKIASEIIRNQIVLAKKSEYFGKIQENKETKEGN